MVKKLKSPRRLAALAVFAIVAMSAFGFAAANTVTSSQAGDGAGAVSGGAASNIHYVMVAGTTEIAEVHFDFAPASANVRVGLLDGPTLAANELASATCGASALPGYDYGCSFGPSGSNVTALQLGGVRVTTWD